MKKMLLGLTLTAIALPASAFSIGASAQVNADPGSAGAGARAEVNGGNPVGFGLGIASDAVRAGLGIAQSATQGALNIAGQVVAGVLNPQERRSLRGYCRRNPPSQRQLDRMDSLPDDWQGDVVVNQPLSADIRAAAQVIPPRNAGLSGRVGSSVLLRVDSDVIVVDARTGVVVDLLSL